MKGLGYPTDLKLFLKACGNTENPVKPEDFNKNMKERVDEVIKNLSKMMGTGDFKSSSDVQGRCYIYGQIWARQYGLDLCQSKGSSTAFLVNIVPELG